MSTETKKKIMVIPPPAAGHLNPLCGIINEMCKNKDLEVIFYSNEPYRAMIEKTGAQFRLYDKPTFGALSPKLMTEKSSSFAFLLDFMINFSYDLLPQLISEVEKEQFDMIIYDGFFMPTKFLIEIIRTRHAKGDFPKLPKFAAFAPNFPINDKMVKMMRENSTDDIWAALSILNTFKRQFMLSWTYGISVYNPIKFFTAKDEKLNIVAVIPEMQPFRDEFDDTFKFVGPCISEEARSVEITNDPELKSMLGQFDTKKPDQKLIFMSLGTVFNVNTFVFEKTIEALNQFDSKPNRHFKLSQFKVILSVGEQGMKKLSGTKSENILIRAKVPQLEVLKRADLFITHCGFNSSTETIKYGVPIIAMPIDGDQPMNAKQMCDELSIGVRLNPRNLNVDQIGDAIDQVLSDAKYKQNVEDLSKTMAKYNGSVEGAKIFVDFLNQ